MRRRPVGDGLSALERLHLEQRHKTLRAAEKRVMRSLRRFYPNRHEFALAE